MSADTVLFTPGPEDAEQLSAMGGKSFYESHHTSASAEDINEYIAKTYSVDRLRGELNDPKNIFIAAGTGGVIAGFAKIIPDALNPAINSPRPCKMERLYVLEDFLPLKIGQQLFDASLSRARELQQSGIWLNTWTGNPRAIRFYAKQGFSIIGETSFRISATHSNPNYLMWMPFSQ